MLKIVPQRFEAHYYFFLALSTLSIPILSLPDSPTQALNTFHVLHSLPSFLPPNFPHSLPSLLLIPFTFFSPPFLFFFSYLSSCLSLHFHPLLLLPPHFFILSLSSLFPFPSPSSFPFSTFHSSSSLSLFLVLSRKPRIICK